MNIGIVVVNWNGLSIITKCIESVLCHSTAHSIELVVVDNNSTDGSLELIKSIDDKFAVIENSYNVGFARACNQGASLCNSDLLMFLNPDTELLKGAIDGIVSAFSDEKVGICGPALVDESQSVQKTCVRFPKPLSIMGQSIGADKFKLCEPHFMKYWDHHDTRFVDQVIGACFVIRTRLFQQVSGFDEMFFVYYEELDLSLRVSKLGYKTLFLSSVKVYHEGGGATNKAKAKRLYYVSRSKMYYAHKHFNRLDAKIICLVTMFIEPLARSVNSLIAGDIRGPSEVISGYKRIWQKWRCYLKGEMYDSLLRQE